MAKQQTSAKLPSMAALNLLLQILETSSAPLGSPTSIAMTGHALAWVTCTKKSWVWQCWTEALVMSLMQAHLADIALESQAACLESVSAS